jgi:hypothetical protein
MKRYIVWGMAIAFLSITFAGEMAFADDRNGAPSLDRIPVVNIQPTQPEPSGDANLPAYGTELPAAAAPKESSGGDAPLFDIMILRPAGILACAAGLVASVVALPFSLPSGSQGKVMKTLVVDPFAYTFARPVGQIE